MNEGGETLMAAIPAGDDALVFVQPGEQTLDLPAPPVPAQWTAVLSGGSGTVAAMRRDQFNALGSEFLIERITVVGTIPDKSSGSSHGEGFSERRLDKGDFMWRSRSRVHGEWKTSSVCNNHELRTLAPLGLSNFEPPFFATVKVPSMKHSERSMPPRSSRSRATASNSFLSTPAFTQREKRRKQVEPEGKRSGKSAQAAPVRSTQRMPFRTARSECICGRPRPSSRRTCFGIRGSRITHCSSLSCSALLMPQGYVAHPAASPSSTHVSHHHL